MMNGFAKSLENCPPYRFDQYAAIGAALTAARRLEE